MGLFKKKVFSVVEDLYQDMISKKRDDHEINKYVISYRILDKKHIEVKSNVGKTRIVANNKANLKKLDQVIIRCKIEIAKRIDEYESESTVRLFILLLSIIMLILSFASVCLSFAMGDVRLLLFSLIVFSFIMSLSLITGIHYNILVDEIKSLKKSIGYKLDSEFDLNNIKELIIKKKI